MADEIETVADFRRLYLKAMTDREAKEAIKWDEDHEARILLEAELVLEKVKRAIHGRQLRLARGLAYMKLESKMQQDKKTLDSLAARLREAREIWTPSKFKMFQEMKKEMREAKELITECMKKI